MNKDQKNIDNQILTGKTLLLRVDLNVPVIDGKVQDDTRIKSVIPSIKHIINSLYILTYSCSSSIGIHFLF